MHAKSPAKNSGVDIKSSRPRERLTTGATAARTESTIRLSPRDDGTAGRARKAPFALEN
jgi:hypothetical protein